MTEDRLEEIDKIKIGNLLDKTKGFGKRDLLALGFNGKLIDEVLIKRNIDPSESYKEGRKMWKEEEQKIEDMEKFKESPGLSALENEVVNESSIELAMDYVGKTYDNILGILDNYLDISEENRKLIAIWIIGSYLHKEFSSFPYLFLNAMKGSGKTRTLKLIEAMSWNGALTGSPTESFLFRTASKGTLILDEFEGIGGKDKSMLREVLNAGYKKGAKVPRVKKVFKDKQEEQVVEWHDVYGPKVMANIWGMEEVLGDRCISVVLEKSNNPQKTKLVEDFDTNPYILDVKRTLGLIQCSLCSVVTQKKCIEKWNHFVNTTHNYIITLTTLTTNTTQTTQQHLTSISEEEINMFNKLNESQIDGRNLELYFPLLIIGDTIKEGLFDDILDMAKEKISEKKSDDLMESRDVSVIDFISRREENLQLVPLSDLVQDFRLFYEVDDSGLDWLNPKWFGRALKRLNLIRDKVRAGRGIKVMLDVSKAKDKIKMFRDVEVKNEA